MHIYVQLQISFVWLWLLVGFVKYKLMMYTCLRRCYTFVTPCYYDGLLRGISSNRDIDSFIC